MLWRPITIIPPGFTIGFSRMIFGKSLIKAQTNFLHLIPKNAKVLIAGGGSGRIIEDISQVHPSGLQITYIEISAKMMALSMQRNAAGNTVNYINLPVEESGLTTDFDVAITPFLLDSLSPDNFDEVFTCLGKLIAFGRDLDQYRFSVDRQMVATGFAKNYVYVFKLMGCVEINRLPEIKVRFALGGYRAVHERCFFGDFCGFGCVSERIVRSIFKLANANGN